MLHGDEWLEHAVLHVSAEGMIDRVETGSPKSADSRIGGIVVPGMPNIHSHCFQRLIAGTTGPSGHHTDSFWSWRKAMYRCANTISPEQYAVVASWVFVEMLKAGYTSCAEFHYLHHQADGSAYSRPSEMSEQLFEAASLSGIAMTLLPVLYCSADFGATAVNDAQKRFAHSPRQYLQLLDMCQAVTSGQPMLETGVAFHSLRAVPEQAMTEVLQSLQDQRCPIHIHIAEQPAEIEGAIAHLGARPLEWLIEHYPVDQRWCLVHATHLSEHELQAAAATQAVAGLCPTTEADLGDGVFKTLDWLQANGQFAIGSDSNVRISVAEELRLLEYNERLASGRRNVLTTADTTCGRFLYQHAAKAGGTAIGQPVGRLQAGYRADLVVLDGNHQLLCGRTPDAALDSWIFAGDRSMINSVWVAGRAVVEQGVHAKQDALGSAFCRLVRDFQSL